MNLEKIKAEFKEINNAYFEKEAGENFLRIEVSLKDLNEITILSREISTWLDKQDIEAENYFLDIFSSGTDKVFDLNDAKNYLNEYVQITLKDKIHDNNKLEGYLISSDPIVLKWNKKGQIRKDQLSKENIEEIKLYAKAGK